MTSIKNFTELSKEDVLIAGGKGASLGEMTKAGIPVPAGFVLPSQVFEEFLEKAALAEEIAAILASINPQVVDTVEKAAEKIRALILSQEIPLDLQKELKRNFNKLDAKFVAVRSSATAEDSVAAAWAGQLDSFLNVTEEKFLESVKKCWASLFTPRAIAYRFEKRLEKEKIAVAVVVQKMVDSEKAGVAFSVHPVLEDRNRLLIEAGFGLGELVVAGSITPDSYLVNKKNCRILELNKEEQSKALFRKKEGGNQLRELGEKGKKQVLAEDEIIELSKLIVKIEKHYGFPCDIEWAKEKGKFYIVQSRPITTLAGFRNPRKIFTKEHSREYSFFRLASWYHSMSQGLKGIIGDGVSEACAVYKGGDLIDIYYDPIELKRVFAKIAERAQDKELIEKEIKNFLKLFANLKDYYLGKKKINSLAQLKKVQELYAFVWAYVAIIFVIPTLPVTKELKKIALDAREKTQEYNETPEAIFKEALERFYPTLKGKTRFILPQEIWSGEVEKTGILKKLADREKGFVYYKEKIYTGNLAKNLESLEIQLEDGSSAVSGKAIVDKNQIKGQTAHKGRVVGKVKIVSSTADLTKVEQQDILVAAMTMPKYLAAMQKAGGFVTDEGGITCHAAIVAREMQKPCIIGTKVATKVLTDGDLVEVDATQGVVKILNKTKD